MTVVFQNSRALMVKNLRPGLTECGKIKIGIKGAVRTSRNNVEFQPPEKLDHFIITTLERGRDGNFVHDAALHARLGPTPKEIPVRLLFNDPWLNFQTTYAAFRGGARFCTGDGERAERIGQDGNVTEMECPCRLLDSGYDGKDKCKINGTLSVVIDGAEVVGGVWKLRTTSINTCQGIASSLALLSSVTGGQIAGVPLTMTIRPKAAVTPQGATTTVYVVGLEFRGSLDALRKLAHERALTDATFGQRMQRVEEQARALLSAPIAADDDATEILDEFYPEAAAEMHGATIVARDISRSSAPPPDDVILVDPDGEERAFAPGEVETIVRTWCAECTDEQLATLVENNPESLEIGHAVAAERAKRARKAPDNDADNDPLRIHGMTAKQAIEVLEWRLRESNAADADKIYAVYRDRIAKFPPEIKKALDQLIADKIGQEYGGRSEGVEQGELV